MVSRALIKAAIKAANTPQPASGNAAGMAAAYGAMYGAPRTYANFLPRPTQDFTAAGFAPGQPIMPVGLDQPAEGEDRPEPRRFPFPVAWNLPIGQPGTEGLGKLADFHTLRLLAEYSSIARACIQLRKAEIRGLAWSIVPTKDAAKAMRGKEGKHEDFAQRKAQAAKFFKKPDPNYSDFSSWLDAALEAVFVLDALSIYLQPTRGKGKGLLGSSLGALCLIDGSSIRPLLDVHGARPRPPSPAFQQYIFGVPRVDLMSVITGDDLDDLEEPVATYRGDQLLYLPMSPRDWSPYGQAPAERCIVPIIASLQRQKYQSDYFQEGTVPSVFVSPGDPNLTPQNIRHMQDTLNAIAGDPAWKHKIIVLPGGSRVDPMHPVALADQFDEIIATQVCMGYDVQPMELGIAPKVSTTQCYAEGTEVLTRAGWKTFDQVKAGLGGDEFATRNPKTHAFEWQHATARYEGDFDGELVEFTNRDFRLRVTPEHRMLLRWQEAKSRRGGRTGEFFKRAGEIRSRKVAIPATSDWMGQTPATVKFGDYEWAASDFAAFLGAWIAEGSLGRQRNELRRCESREIILTQDRGSKGYAPYRDLLTRMLGREPGYRERSRSFFFSCSELWHYLDVLGKAHEKRIPTDVKNWDTEALSALLHHYLLGDGHKDGNRWRASTVSPRLADDLQEIAQKIGMSASITRREPEDTVMADGRTIHADRCRPYYVIGFRSGTARAVTVGRTPYTGKVYCVSVPNETLYVRFPGEGDSPITAVWCGNSPGASNQMAKASKSINDRKSLRPMLSFLKSALFDQVLQDICGQDDMEWKWEGLEEGEDEESLVGNLVVQVNNGIISHDEARAEVGREPWGLPITSDPGVLTPQGFVPLGAIDPATGIPAAQQPALPAEAGEVSPPTPPAGSGGADGAGGSVPAKPKPTPAATPSHAGAEAAVGSQKPSPNQVAKPSGSTKALAGGGMLVAKASPDFADGAMLALYPPRDVAEGLVVPGGLGADELHLTLAYLGKAADVDAAAVEKVADALATRGPISAEISGHARFTGGEKGDVIVALVDSPDLEALRRDCLTLLADQGVEVPADHGYTPHITLTYQSTDRPSPIKRLDPRPVTFPALSLVHGTQRTDVPFRPSAHKRWKSTDKPLTGPAATEAVFTQLAEDYPEDALGWVRDADWSGPAEVPLEEIDTSNASSWRASHESVKVERFKKKIKHKLGKGKPVKPIILVKTPGNTKLIVIDGHHRTMAYQQLGIPAVAWIGEVDAEKGPWNTLHDRQFPQDHDPATDDDTRCGPSRKAMLAELDALGRHLKKGTQVGTWLPRHLPAQVLAVIAEDLTKGLTVDQVIGVARSALPPDDDSEGEQQVAKRAHWPAWDVDQALAANFAPRIRLALSKVLNRSTAHRIAEAWLNTPAHGQPARAWLQDAESALTGQIGRAFHTVLTPLWTAGWAVGATSAAAVLDGKGRVDWSKYRAGAAKASGGQQPPGPVVDPSLMVYDQQSLQEWLDHYGVDSISSIASFRMDDLASLLETALENGDSPDSLSADIEALGASSDAADMIASTEIARAMSQAALASYEHAGVGSIQWLDTGDERECSVCLQNTAVGPVRIGDAFPGGVDGPPQHPRCRCACVPADVSGVSLPSIADLKDILGGF